jgi:hypothetical protein
MIMIGADSHKRSHNKPLASGRLSIPLLTCSVIVCRFKIKRTFVQYSLFTIDSGVVAGEPRAVSHGWGRPSIPDWIAQV